VDERVDGIEYIQIDWVMWEFLARWIMRRIGIHFDDD
jgi:hypothetical protein